MDESVTWLKEIEPAILNHIAEEGKNSIPPSFPLADLAQKMKEAFHMDNVELSYGTIEWKSHETLLNGLGKNPISLPLELTPLEGSLFWIMASEDIEKLLSWMKFGNGDKIKISHPDLLKGVYRYAALEIADIIWNLKAYPKLSLKLAEKLSFDETSYSIDVSIKNGSDIIWGRLALTRALKRSIENHFSIDRITLQDLQKTAGNISLTLSLNIGSVELSQEEIKSLKVGDFIVPDTLSYNPRHERGNIRIMLDDNALFVAKPKGDHIKLMDSVYAYQETTHG